MAGTNKGCFQPSLRTSQAIHTFCYLPDAQPCLPPIIHVLLLLFMFIKCPHCASTVKALTHTYFILAATPSVGRLQMARPLRELKLTQCCLKVSQAYAGSDAPSVLGYFYSGVQRFIPMRSEIQVKKLTFKSHKGCFPPLIISKTGFLQKIWKILN